MSTFNGDLAQLSNLGVTDFDNSMGPGAGNSLSTGDLRRKYNFGDRVSELAIPQDPFFRFVSKVGKKPTDDPQFKWTEKRDSWHKRYAYVSNHGVSAPAALAGTNATVASGLVDSGDTYYFCMIADYESAGNIQNIYGKSANEISPGDSGTQPNFFVPGQLIKVPHSTSVTAASWDDSSASVASAQTDYLVAKVQTVDSDSVANAVVLKTVIVKGESAATELTSYSAYNNAVDGLDISSKSISDYLEPKRSYVVGTAHAEGSGYPETWKDQPYSTNYGRTQIWKTSMAMTNTARATVLKYDANEWARVWKDKLVEHKWDIEQSLLFGRQSDTHLTTQGAVDYVMNYGNQFSLDVNTKTADDFLDDMSKYQAEVSRESVRIQGELAEYQANVAKKYQAFNTRIQKEIQKYQWYQGQLAYVQQMYEQCWAPYQGAMTDQNTSYARARK